MTDKKGNGPGAANDRPAETQTKDASILGAFPADVNVIERIAMLATVDALEWHTLGRKLRSKRPAGVGALRWSRDKIPHRLEPVGNGYVGVVAENGTPIGKSLRGNARYAVKLWICEEMVAWEYLLSGNRLFGSIDDLLDRRRADPRKMLALRSYLVFERCGATRPIIAASTWVRLEQEIRRTAGGQNPYGADLPPWMLPPSTGGAA